MSPTFTSLSVRNYRIYASGAFISNIGTWMGRVAQDWLVLTELTHHSSTALGIVTGLQFLPFLLLAPWAGMIADRYPKRAILAVTQTALALSSLALGLLVVAGSAQLWMVYVIALFTGLATAVDNPARQTFVSEMVPREHLANAVSLNSASFNGGRLIGPGVAGLTIAAFGTGWTLLLNTGTFVAVLVALALIRGRELRPAPMLRRGKGAIKEGVRYVKTRPDIQLVMALVFVLGTFGMNFQITTALMATREFGKGPQEYGLLGSIMAIGSLSAALLSARRGASATAGPAGGPGRLHHLERACRDGADVPAVRAGPDPGGAVRPDRADHGQRHGAAQRRPRHAWTGHGALHGDLHGGYPPRRPVDRLDRSGLGPTLDHRHRHGGCRSDAGGDFLLDDSAREYPGELRVPPSSEDQGAHSHSEGA